MEALDLKLKNIKCDGCVTNIKNVLNAFTNIDTVAVNKEDGSVKISGSSLNKKEIVSSLSSIGYPEKSFFN